jgi:hypothetical protein
MEEIYWVVEPNTIKIIPSLTIKPNKNKSDPNQLIMINPSIIAIIKVLQILLNLGGIDS